MRTKIHFIFSFVVIFLLKFSSIQAQQIITIKSKNDLIFVQKELYYFVDTTNLLTIKDIAAAEHQQKFQQNLQGVFQSRTSYKNYWLKLSIQNKSQQAAWIDLSTSFLGTIDYYVPTPQGYQLRTQTGTLRPMSNKAFPTNTFWLPLGEQDSTQTIYFCVTSWRNIELPIYVGSTNVLVQQKTIQDFIAAAFMGLGLMLIFYNLSLFFVIRDSVYLWYSGYIFWAINLFTFLNHYPYFTHLLDEETRIWFSTKTVYWGSLLNFFVAGFGIKFLGLRRKTPLVYYWLLVLTFTIVVLVPLSSYFGILKSFTVIKVNLFLLLQLSLFATGIYLWIFKKEKNARFYVIAWFWLFLSSVFYVFVTNGYLPYNYFTRNANFWGLSLEVLFFSLALGDRIVLLRKEKEDAQAKNISLIQQQNVILEQKVTERTEELNLTLQTVEKQRDNIISSINYALRIQNAIIPKEQEIQKHFPESFVLFKPKDIVSGDFYWFADKIVMQNEKEISKKIIVVADCTGHGVSGAFMTMIGNNILNQIVHDQEITQPNEILNLMTPLLEKTLLHSEGKVKDGMDISIIVIHLKGFQNPSGVTIEYAGAMNPLYYIENQEFKEIKADKVPIGGKQKEGFSYKNYELEITNYEKYNNDVIRNSPFVIYLCTDGFQDQFGGTEKRKFMVSKFKKLLLEISEKPMAEQKQILETTISDWIAVGNETQTDDICVVGIKL